METNTPNYNRIFQYTVTGAILFILTIAFIVSNMSDFTKLNIPYAATAVVLGVSSVSLLYKAIREDDPRMRSMQ